MRNGIRSCRFLLVTLAVALLASPAVMVKAQRVGDVAAQQPASDGQQISGVPATPIGTAVVNFADLAREEQSRVAAIGPDRPTSGIVRERGMYPEPEARADPSASAPAPHDSIPGPNVASPSPARSFLGLDDISPLFIPPDTEGAVGLDRVFTTLNNNYRVLNKATGATISTVSMATFWASTGASGPFDPKTVYDPYNDRFIVSAVSNAASTTSSILLGVSNTSDPNGTWTLWRYLACGVAFVCGPTTSEWWADYPELGFNTNWAAVSVNMFTNSANASQESRLFVVNYATLRSGAAPVAALFMGLADFTIVPVVTYSASETTLYAPNHSISGSRSYRLNTITGTADSPVYTQGPLKTHTLVSAWVQPSGDPLPQSPEPGTALVRGINGGDSRIINAVFRNNAIWYAQSVGLPAGGPLTRMAAQWIKLDTSGNDLDGGRVEDPTATSTNGGKWYAFPSIAVNKNNDALLGFSQFSSAQFPSAGYTFRSNGDPAGTMRDPVISKAGIGFYYKTYSGSRNRWGDYSASQVDPVDDTALWTLQEYSKAQVGTGNGSGFWSTWWVQVVLNLFTDDPLISGTTLIQAVHITEMQTRIDAVRASRGLGGYSWRAITVNTTTILAQDVIDLRTALDQTDDVVPTRAHYVYTRAIAIGQTILAQDITETRAALVARE